MQELLNAIESFFFLAHHAQPTACPELRMKLPNVGAKRGSEVVCALVLWVCSTMRPSEEHGLARYLGRKDGGRTAVERRTSNSTGRLGVNYQL